MNKHIIVVILTITLTLALSGCVQNEGKKVYYSPENNETITFYDDHTFISINPSRSISGAYRIDDPYLILIYPPFGTTGQFKISGKDLIDEQAGETWRRV